MIPKSMLVQLGLGDSVDLSVQGDSLVLRKPTSRPRAGWGKAVHAIAEEVDGTEDFRAFGNLDDDANTW